MMIQSIKIINKLRAIFNSKYKKDMKNKWKII